MTEPHDMNREWELDGAKHRTSADAYRQLIKAKLGSHVAATDTYLAALKQYLYSWIKEIDAELDSRAHQVTVKGK